MKKTTLYNTHLALNAKMTSFAGYEMPIQYTGIKKEHLTEVISTIISRIPAPKGNSDLPLQALIFDSIFKQ